MKFEKSNLLIESDFEIRMVREENEDVDILIPLENRTLNLYFDDIPKYVKSRLQFPMIKNIIIRFSNSNDNNILTVHLLRNIDFQSSVANFEIDYTNFMFKVKRKEYSVEMWIKIKKF